jgi:uncharacterized protein YegL
MRTKKKVNMGKKTTHVCMVLDQSGSMCTTKVQAVQGYNEQIQQMKLNAKDQNILGSLVTFNGEVFEHLWCEEATNLAEATVEDYVTEGSTAMRDAIGYTVEKLLKTTDSKDDDVAYLVVIISDGEENASRHYSVESLKELIQSVQKTGKWTFTYMGCDDEYIKKVAKETAIPLANMAKWSNASPELATRGMVHNRKCLDAFYQDRLIGSSGSSSVYANCAVMSDGIADFTSPIADADLLVKPENLNVVNTVSTATPFKNYSPVNWQV